MPLQHPRFAHNQRLQNAAQNSPPLRKGETGEAILILQQALGDLGFSIGTRTGVPDGVLGEGTIAALGQFHSTFGIPPDTLGGRSSVAGLDGVFLKPVSARPPHPAPGAARQPLAAVSHANLVHSQIPHATIGQGLAVDGPEHIGGRTSVGGLGTIFFKPGSGGTHLPHSGYKVLR